MSLAVFACALEAVLQPTSATKRALLSEAGAQGKVSQRSTLGRLQLFLWVSLLY